MPWVRWCVVSLSCGAACSTDSHCIKYIMGLDVCAPHPLLEDVGCLTQAHRIYLRKRSILQARSTLPRAIPVIQSGWQLFDLQASQPLRRGLSSSVFETTIRYLGGLLSAYELSGQNNTVLLHQAQDVADKMAFAWHTVSLFMQKHDRSDVTTRYLGQCFTIRRTPTYHQ